MKLSRQQILVAALGVSALGLLLSRWPRSFLRTAWLPDRLRHRGVEVLESHAKPEDIPLLVDLTRDSDSRVRRGALRVLLERHPEVKFDSRVALPELVEIFKESGSVSEVSKTGIFAGQAISRISGVAFNFRTVPLRCGTPYLEAGLLIQEGQKMGGIEGQKKVAQGEAMSRGLKESDVKLAAETNAKNLAEKERLLKWWTAEGRAKYESNGG